MAYGYFEKGFGFAGRYISLRVEGYSEMTYYGYSRQEAESKYRKQMGLTYRHITWVDMNKALTWFASVSSK